MAETKALHEQLDAFIASRKAAEGVLQQQRDEAYKVADYLKQKLDSLENIIDDLSNGKASLRQSEEQYTETVPALPMLAPRPAPGSLLARSTGPPLPDLVDVLRKAARRQTEEQHIEASTALPIPAPKPARKPSSVLPTGSSILDNVEASLEPKSVNQRLVARARAPSLSSDSSSSDSSCPELLQPLREPFSGLLTEPSLLDNVEASFKPKLVIQRPVAKATTTSAVSDSSSPESDPPALSALYLPKLPSPPRNKFNTIKLRKGVSTRQLVPQTALATITAQNSAAAKTFKEHPAKKRKHSVVFD
ncbi:hypothetical protein LTR17_006091 [Elasticomyces elasticus]|nr:hypothetical protein LTR17_006091 [Elasticomyces elasticus]